MSTSPHNAEFILAEPRPTTTQEWGRNPQQLDLDRAVRCVTFSALTGAEKLVLLAHVTRRRSGGTGWNYPCDVARCSVEHLMQATGLSRNRAGLVRARLVNIGILEPYDLTCGQERHTYTIRFDLIPAAGEPVPPPAKQQRRDLGVPVRRRVYMNAKGRCVACSSILERGWHMDHIVPLSKGGADEESNLQAMCPACNQAKGST